MTISIMNDEDLKIFWKNRKNTFSCNKCSKNGYLYEDYKSAFLLRYNCGHIECMQCMLKQKNKIQCHECNEKYSVSLYSKQVAKNLPFLIQNMYNKYER